VPIRASVLAVPTYVAGAKPAGTEQLAWLASNENPFEPVEAVQTAIVAAAARVNRYPELIASTLTAALAERHGVQQDQIVAGTGSVAVLAHAVQALADAEADVVYPWRSFESYPILTGIAGAQAVHVPLGDNGRIDLGQVLDALTPRTRIVILCTPNNPTSTALQQTELVEFLKAAPADVAVFLDEAYAEFVTDPAAASGIPLIGKYPNLVVFRTFSKAYGLAGLRVGYSVSHPTLAAGIRACTIPFGVNEVAASAALAALAAEAEIMTRVDQIVTERERMKAALRDQGWNLPDSQANYFWLALGAATTDAAALARQNDLLVRAFPGEGIRVSLGTPAENDRVLAVTKRWRGLG
jgi:histidinol-phosphate aminotransferase